MKTVLELFDKNIKTNRFIKATFSSPNLDLNYSKIILKPIKIKDKTFIQFEIFKDKKAYHQNKNLDEALEFLKDIISKFKQILLLTTDEELHILKKKERFSIKRKTIEKQELNLSHNKEKNYILKENTAIPFLIKLGIMNSQGVVIKNRFNKFRQINRYLEFIENTIDELQEKNLIQNSIKVVDFGCGKSYLTFALYHYLKNIKNLQIDVIGLDLKDDVIKNCNQIAKELEFSNLKFLHGDIKDFTEFKDVDLMFSLHACNTATDYAILKSLELKAKAILAVPCCQSEINQKISQSKTTHLKKELSPLGNYGLLQERFSSLATDALRALSIERCGFDTKVIEFIDMEHTPKNILIKGVLSTNLSEVRLKKKKEEYERYLEFLGVEPLIHNLLKGYFKY